MSWPAARYRGRSVTSRMRCVDVAALFYCGNGYGMTGIGTAVAEPLT